MLLLSVSGCTLLLSKHPGLPSDDASVQNDSDFFENDVDSDVLVFDDGDIESDADLDRDRDILSCDPPLNTDGRLVAVQTEDIQVDGSLIEWMEADFFQVLPGNAFVCIPSPCTFEREPSDISARIAAQWSPEMLYLAVEVTDDVTIAPNPENPLFEGDSLQIIIDTQYDRTTDYDDNDLDIGWAKMSTGDSQWHCWYPEDLSTIDGSFSISRIAETTIYEISLSLADLRDLSQLQNGQRIGIAFVINEYDNSYRDGSLVWPSDLDQERTPNTFGTIHLVNERGECLPDSS